MLSKPRIKACVLAMMLAAPLYANAAGLGRLNVQSGLGQPFRAEIDLVAVTPEEADSLVVSLASPDAFASANIQYPSGSLGLRFNIEKRGGGQYYVAINSSQPVSEPFLDLLLELNWAGGRIQREYTALIDPVDYSAQRPSTALPGRLSGKTPAPAASKPAATSEAPSRPARPSRAVPSEAAGSEAGANEVKVKSGDTLSSIAGQVKPEGVSLDQVLVSLYRANPDAFAGNMNRLKRGKILRVPAREEMEGVSRNEAAKEIRLQADNWRGYRQQVAEGAMTTPAADQGQSTSGKISAKVEDKGGSQAENQDRLKLSKGGDAGKSGKGNGEAQARIRTLEEEAAARQKALDEANQRVVELEKLVKDMNKALPKGGAKTTPVPTAAPTAAPTPEPTAAPTPEPVVASTASSASAAAVAPVASEPASAPVKPKRRAPVEIEAPVEEEPSFLAGLLDNPLLLGGGLGVLLLGVGGLLWARRRRPAAFEDSIITGGDLKPNTVLGSTGGAVISTQPTENSFLTDFSRQGLGTIDTDEVDPIAEAEVYMAYGRDGQAEEILKDALSKDPSRNEIRMKLLEIYSARKDKTSFEEIAADLFARTNGAGPVWEQAAYMGRNLDAENPLYAQKDPGRAAAPVNEPPASAFTETTAVAAAAAAAPIDLDLGFDSEPSPVPAPQPAPQAALDAVTEPAPIDDLDFDLDALVAPEATQAPVAPAPAASDFDDLDFGLDLDQPAPAPVAAAPIADLGLDIAELDMPTVAEPVPAQAAAPQDIDLDFDFNLDAPTTGAAPAPEEPLIDLEQDTVSELDFSAEDPVQTKIDLARAYIDMGDVEGAREILQEAMSEGSDSQQQEARGLLDNL
ncbi:FimV/HubP family polar landmark protein [Chitinolyticbacter meiyuanensis]|uniref:FimV/HubP family polar landmark protein n=1 Tax=Chitinolyticbacter meiyuanensis TaxID=682798 RepID=UPI0011E5A30C|nr:FimV/HubP family polar landmark protein [Chitinolyticbacter meiyuanensis]